MRPSIACYTISRAGWNGLLSLLPDAPVATWRPECSAFGVDLILDVPEHREGISHLLNTFPILLSDPAHWIDQRPPSIRQDHLIQLDPPPHLKEYYPKPIKAVPWRYVPTPQDISYMEEDDTPWEQLPEEEQLLRLSILQKPLYKDSRTILLRDDSRQFYYNLAMYWKMASRNNSPKLTSFVAAALEAIGLKWIAPPKDTLETALAIKNHNKYRPEFTNAGNGLSSSRPKLGSNVQGFMNKTAEDYKAIFDNPVKYNPPDVYTEQDLQLYIDNNMPEMVARARLYLDEHPPATPTDDPTDKTPKSVKKQGYRTLQAIKELL